MGRKLVIDEEWDCKQRGLKGNEASVLAVIVRCSRGDSPKGWYGSFQALADCIPFSIDEMTVNRAVKKLLSMGIIEYRNGAYWFTQNEEHKPQIEGRITQNEAYTPQIEANSAPLNNPPLMNINNNDQKEENETRTQTRDEEKGTFIMEVSFNNFWTAFHPSKEMNSRKAQCRWLWEDIIPYSVRQQIFNELLALESQGQITQERNPFFYLRNFAPREPHDWNGDHSIDQETAAKLISAKYGDHYGSFTPEHVLLFHLEVADSCKTKWEAYLKYVMSDPNKKPIKYS